MGADQATTDEKLAQLLLAGRLSDLEDRRRRRQRGEAERDAYLIEYAAHHLAIKARTAAVTVQWLEAARNHLYAAIQFFCNGGRDIQRQPDGSLTLHGISDRPLAGIDVSEVQGFVYWLSQRPNRRQGTLSPSSQRKALNSLSNLYRRAVSERRVPPNYNPVASMLEKPQDGTGRAESRWLEVPEAALLLEAVRTYMPKRADAALPEGTLHAIVATMLLTGGRPAEVLGLEAGDVSFDRRTVTFRPNATRARLKTAGSHRSVRRWPQLEDVLRRYVEQRGLTSSSVPLFPSARTDGRVIDIRKALDAAAGRAGWGKGDVRPYAFRHTYCAARLQTLDGGAPVSPYTVARELGHGGLALVNRVYGHLGDVRHRSDVVEYRVEQHHERLADRLDRLRGTVV